MLLAGNLDEDQQRVVVTIANFGSQSDSSESFDEFSKLLSSFTLAYDVVISISADIETLCTYSWLRSGRQ